MYVWMKFEHRMQKRSKVSVLADLCSGINWVTSHCGKSLIFFSRKTLVTQEDSVLLSRKRILKYPHTGFVNNSLMASDSISYRRSHGALVPEKWAFATPYRQSGTWKCEVLRRT